MILGLLGWFRPHSIRYVARVLFPIGAIVCLGVAVFAGIFLATGHAPEVMILPLGLPDLPFHFRLDALSAFFLLLLGLAGAGISTFAAGYFRSGEGTAPALLGLHYHVFLASMAMVILADDAYLFMVAWETMALSSYFLVTSHHRIPEIRAAGFLYRFDPARRHRRRGGHHVCASASCGARAHTAHGNLGLRLSLADLAHAGYGGGIRSTHSPHVRNLLSHRARYALAHR